ncbi:MAG: protein kinase [Gemmatimonadota bacterium]
MPPVDSALQQSLSTAYRLERELGRGGMAVVYLAHDLKHARHVALKAIRPDYTAEFAAERFSREIRLAARLQHPHILPVLDSGESAGQLWYTMPYVRGESLRDRIRREERLDVNEAVRIAREAAQALEYAHREGVVHRDIKPENILIAEDGSALVADFGIAKAIAGPRADRTGVGPDGPAQTNPLTGTGLIVGTPAYMAPEQRLGMPGDARSDIYSLAAVLYEMLTGKMVIGDGGGMDMFLLQMSDSMPRVRVTRPEVPVAVEQVVRKGLHPDPGQRFASMADFGKAMQDAVTGSSRASVPPITKRRIVTIAGLVLGFALAVAAGFAWRRSVGPRSTPAGGSLVTMPLGLAVLPFENLGDTSDAYFADGVTDAVRGKLTQLGKLVVIARTSSMEYRGRGKSLGQIARELGVRYLLTGTVRWAKSKNGLSQVQVSPELVEIGDTPAPTSRWQQDFNRPLTDVFEVQGEIAQKVASALDLALEPAQTAELAATPTTNVAAYDAFLKGEAVIQGFTHNDGASLQRAIAFYREAVAKDSTFGIAWARLGHSHVVYYVNGPGSEQDDRDAEHELAKAIAFAPEAPETYMARSSHAFTVHGDTVEMRRLNLEMLKLFPRNAEAIAGFADGELALGRFAAADSAFRRALTLDPRSVVNNTALAQTSLFLRRYADVRAAADRADLLSPGDPQVLAFRVVSHLGEGNLAEARQIVAGVSPGSARNSLLAELNVQYEVLWMFDDATQRAVLELPADAVGGEGDRAIEHAGIYRLRGDTANERRWAKTALSYVQRLRSERPDDPIVQAGLARTLAHLGRSAEAVSAAERALQLQESFRFRWIESLTREAVIKTLIEAGRPDLALDQLVLLLSRPSYISPAWLRIDPDYAPLKGNARFESLVNGQR